MNPTFNSTSKRTDGGTRPSRNKREAPTPSDPHLPAVAACSCIRHEAAMLVFASITGTMGEQQGGGDSRQTGVHGGETAPLHGKHWLAVRRLQLGGYNEEGTWIRAARPTKDDAFGSFLRPPSLRNPPRNVSCRGLHVLLSTLLPLCGCRVRQTGPVLSSRPTSSRLGTKRCSSSGWMGQRTSPRFTARPRQRQAGCRAAGLPLLGPEMQSNENVEDCSLT